MCRPIINDFDGVKVDVDDRVAEDYQIMSLTEIRNLKAEYIEVFFLKFKFNSIGLLFLFAI